MSALTVEQIVERGPLEDPPQNALWKGINPYLQAQIVSLLGQKEIQIITEEHGDELRKSATLAACQRKADALSQDESRNQGARLNALSVQFALQVELRDFSAAEQTLALETAIYKDDPRYSSDPDRLKIMTDSRLSYLCFERGDFRQAEQLYAGLTDVLAAEPNLGKNSPQYLGHIRGQIESTAHMAKDERDHDKAREVVNLLKEAWLSIDGMKRTKWAAFEAEERTELAAVELRAREIIGEL